MLPSNALERALFLEADRMRGPRLTEENLRNQVDVVKEEIRVNVLNRPYGGFPWLKLPPVMFDTFAERARRVRLVRRPRVGDRRRRGELLRAVLRGRQRGARRSPATSTSTPTARADRAALRRRTGPAGARPARLRRARSRPPSAGDVLHRPAGPAARGRGGLAGAGPDHRLRRLPALRGAGRGAHRRRRVPAGAAAGAARPQRAPASAATWASWATRSTSATRPRCCCRPICHPAVTSTGGARA